MAALGAVVRAPSFGDLSFSKKPIYRFGFKTLENKKAALNNAAFYSDQYREKTKPY